MKKLLDIGTKLAMYQPWLHRFVQLMCKSKPLQRNWTIAEILTFHTFNYERSVLETAACFHYTNCQPLCLQPTEVGNCCSGSRQIQDSVRAVKRRNQPCQSAR